MQVLVARAIYGSHLATRLPSLYITLCVINERSNNKCNVWINIMFVDALFDWEASTKASSLVYYLAISSPQCLHAILEYTLFDGVLNLTLLWCLFTAPWHNFAHAMTAQLLWLAKLLSDWRIRIKIGSFITMQWRTGIIDWEGYTTMTVIFCTFYRIFITHILKLKRVTLAATQKLIHYYPLIWVKAMLFISTGFRWIRWVYLWPSNV